LIIASPVRAKKLRIAKKRSDEGEVITGGQRLNVQNSKWKEIVTEYFSNHSTCGKPFLDQTIDQMKRQTFVQRYI
jgi:hypothetical protein